MNERLIAQGKNPQQIVKNFKFNRDGVEQVYHMVDARRMINLDDMTRMNAITSLKLRFLNSYFSMMGNDRKINVTKDMNGRSM